VTSSIESIFVCVRVGVRFDLLAVCFSRIRVGFVMAHFHMHSVSKMISRLILTLPKLLFEVILFYFPGPRDFVTEMLQCVEYLRLLGVSLSVTIWQRVQVPSRDSTSSAVWTIESRSGFQSAHADISALGCTRVSRVGHVLPLVFACVSANSSRASYNTRQFGGMSFCFSDCPGG
jgi:hypothetical protein